MDLQTNYPPEIFATLGTSECFLTIVISFMDLQTQWSMDLFHIWNSWMVSHLYKFFNRFSNLLITGNCLNILNNGIVFYHFESHYESSNSLTNSNCCHIWNNLIRPVNSAESPRRLRRILFPHLRGEMQAEILRSCGGFQSPFERPFNQKWWCI